MHYHAGVTALSDVVQEAWLRLADDARTYEVSQETLVEHVQRVAGATPPPDVHLADLLLALACANGSLPALRKFEQDVLPSALPAIRRLEDDGAFVDEVCQVLRTRLLVAERDRPPRIIEYAGRGPLAGWITVSAVRTGLNLLRSKARRDRRTREHWAGALTLPDTGNAELEYLKDRYRDVFTSALIEAVQALPPRPRALLRMYFAQNVGIDGIGQVYGVHRSTAARWLIAAKQSLLEETRRILGEREGLAPSELSSLERLVRSQVELSLHGLLE